MPIGPHVRALIIRLVLAQRRYNPLDRDYTTVRHLMREASVRFRLILTQQDLPRARVYPITANNHIRLCLRAVRKAQHYLTAPLLIDITHELLPIPEHALGQAIEHPAEKLRAHTAAVVELTTWHPEHQRGGRLRGLLGVGGVAVPVPIILVVRPVVDAAEGVDDVRAEALHTLARDAGEGEPGAEVVEGGGPLVDGHAHVAVQEPQGYHEPDDAAAYDGDVELGVGAVVCVFSSMGARGRLRRARRHLWKKNERGMETYYDYDGLPSYFLIM